MKIICKKADIINSVNIAIRAVPGKTTMPILECIIIRADSNNIKFVTNNMELAIETVVKGRIIEEGSVAVNARFFSEMIRKLPDNDVTIQTDSHYITTITCEKAEFSINSKPDDEFPNLPAFEKNDALEISQFALREVIRQTVFSISDNASQKLMVGEYFEINDDNLRVVALDGHRIAIRTIKLKDAYKPTKVIIPGSTLNEITKILTGEVEDKISIYFSKCYVLFEMEDTIVLSRLIEGDYYKINQMLSGEYNTKLNINRKELLDCIDRSTLLLKETDKKPILFTIRDLDLNLKVISQLGTMNEDIEINKEGKDITVGLNPKYMLDVLRVIDDENITMYLTNEASPCFIKNDDESYIYLILPVSVPNYR